MAVNSRFQLVTAGVGGTSSLFNAALPNAGTAIGVLDTATGEMVPLKSTGGLLLVSAAVTVSAVESSTFDANLLGTPGTVGTSSVAFLAANNTRKKLLIQNAGTT